MEHPVYIELLFAIVGVLFIVLGIPLKQGAVPPNRWYGFRTRKTLSDEEIWYEINRVTGIDMIRAGGVILATSLVMLAFRNWISPDTAVMILLAVMLGTVGWMAFHGFSLLKKM